MTDPTAEAVKLLPCPFCGSLPLVAVDEEYGVFVGCQTEGCEIAEVRERHFTQEQAINKWNTRPQPAPPEGDPDAIIAELKLAIANAVEGDDPGSVVSVPLVVAQRILDRLGLAARQQQKS